jgi:hypothetical protein
MKMTGIKAAGTSMYQTGRVKKEHRRLRRERTTVRVMVGLYCAHHHGTTDLCDACSDLVDYADRRLDLCPYGSDKPSCANCPIHCYRPEPRERMREVMRFAGPRMLARHPVLAIRHLIDDRRPVPQSGMRRGLDREKDQTVTEPRSRR